MDDKAADKSSKNHSIVLTGPNAKTHSCSCSETDCSLPELQQHSQMRIVPRCTRSVSPTGS
jgi:hypothetical protein